MQGVTLLVALLSSGAILVAPRRYVLPVFLGALAWYPTYLSVRIGTVDFTAARIVILAALGRMLVDRESVARFRWCLVDAFVVLGLAGGVLAGLMTVPSAELLENRAGSAFNTLLPYLAVRLGIRTRGEYKTLLLSLLAIGMPLAVLGGYQSWTGDNPVAFGEFSTWAPASYVPSARHGFFRADVTFSHFIAFGLFFAMVGPLCAGLWGYVRRKGLLVGGLALMLVGMLSSMSSGPWLAGIVACGVMAFYRFRRYWRVALVLLIVWLGAIEIGSNRHWYYVLGDFTLDPSTAWSRIRLMEVAFGGGMSGHWLAGFGPFADPGWGPVIENRQHTDIVNDYVLTLVESGLLGLVPFVGAVGGAFMAVRRGYRRAPGPEDNWLVWCLLSSLAGILAAMFSVSLMGQVRVLFFVMLGLCSAVASPGFFRRSSANGLSAFRHMPGGAQRAGLAEVTG